MAFLEPLRMSRPVRDAIQESRGALLPGEIAHDRRVSWLLKFERAEERRGEHPREIRSRGNRFFEALTDEQVSRPGQRRVESPSPIEQLLRDIFTNKIEFFFFSLFVIGRQWKVCESAALEISELQNSSLTVQPLQNGDELYSFASRKDVQASVSRVLDIARQKHTCLASEAHELWHLWCDEVDFLRWSLDSFNEAHSQAMQDPRRIFDEEHYRYRHVRDRYYDSESPDIESFIRSRLSRIALADDFGKPVARSSSLFQRLASQRPEIAWWRDISLEQRYETTMALDSTIGTALQALSDSLVESRQHLERELRDVKKAVEQEPQERLAATNFFEFIKKKFSIDPFAVYDTRPADGALYKLIRENTHKNGTLSAWLAAWYGRLRPELERYGLKVNPEDLASKPWSETADAIIKRKVGEYDIQASEDWRQYIQRLFEKELIEPLASALYKQKQVRKSSAASLGKILQPLVDNLRDMGYELSLTDSKRLDKLLDRLEKSQSLGYSGTLEW
jgi:hypothetical protein